MQKVRFRVVRRYSRRSVPTFSLTFTRRRLYPLLITFLLHFFFPPSRVPVNERISWPNSRLADRMSHGSVASVRTALERDATSQWRRRRRGRVRVSSPDPDRTVCALFPARSSPFLSRADTDRNAQIRADTQHVFPPDRAGHLNTMSTGHKFFTIN